MRAPVYHGKADEPQANSLHFTRNMGRGGEGEGGVSNIDEILV